MCHSPRCSVQVNDFYTVLHLQQVEDTWIQEAEVTLFTVLPRSTVKGFVASFSTTLSFSGLWSWFPEVKCFYQGNINDPVEPV